MRTNSRPQIRGAWYYDVGDLVMYRTLLWRVTYAYAVRSDGERQNLTLVRDNGSGDYYVSTDNLSVDPMGSQ